MFRTQATFVTKTARVSAVWCLWLSTTAIAWATPVTDLFIFGDSLSDPGNNAVVFGSIASPPFNVTLQSQITSNSFIPSYPYASSYQYSNGDVWAYQFATMLGLPSQVAGPVLAGGLGGNYASGGATTGPLNGGGFPPSLLTQVADFITSLGPAQAPAGALYVVAGGGNNLRAALAAIAGGADPAVTIAATADQFALDIGEICDDLQERGAVDIVVWNVANAGLAPAIAADGPAAASLGTSLAAAMNEALGQRLASESDVRTFDLFGLVSSIHASPAAYGLTNVTDAAGAVPGANPSTYLSWDGIHPTSAGHAIIAQSVYAFVVPEPAAPVLCVTGMIVFLAVHGRIRFRSR